MNSSFSEKEASRWTGVMDEGCLDRMVSALVGGGYKVIAPRRDGERVVYGPIEEGGEFVRDYTNAQNSPKDFFFPMRDELFSFGEGVEALEIPPAGAKRAFLGVRPCDASAVKRLDSLFNWDYPDLHYNRRREDAALIGLACNDPPQACFCASLGGGAGPHCSDDVDLMLTKLDSNSYLAQAVTEKGELLASLITCATPASSEDVEVALSLRMRAEKRIGEKGVLEGVSGALERVFEASYWERVARNCVNCGVCTYLCPTCYCFDIQDEGGSRVRFWDSCQFKLYSKQATGHNPRDQSYKRFRNRVYHKFVYFKKNLGETLCVGCGRCIAHCPEGVDIFEIVSAVKDLNTEIDRTEG